VSTSRRVRRVRLAAPHPDLVRRGAVLLEDALHTASIPGGDGGRLVLVRSLDVGRIHPRAAPSTLALAIERRLREVELTAVHAEDSSAPAASAVWFRDAAEACALLAVRLAAGAPVDAWFWPSAVPGWRAGMDVGEGIRLALRAAAESPQGAAAVAEMLRVALDRGAADRLLLTTLPTIASGLLHAYGWTSLDAGDADRAEPVPSAWRPLLARWIGTWGVDDVRSRWLAATVLVAERPSRVADRTLPSRAAALARAVLTTLPTICARDDDAPASPSARRPAADADPAPPPPPRAQDPAPHADARHRTNPPADPPPVDSGDAHRPEADAAGMDANPRIRNPDPQIAAERKPAEGEVEAAREDDSHPHPADLPEVRAEKRAADEDRPPAESPEARRAAERRRARVEPEGPQPTEAGGLFFVVAAMQRLGMAEVLRRYPELLEADLPGRVLLRVAERTRVPADDPVMRCLEAPRDAGETGARYAFQAPELWSRAVARSGEGHVRRDAHRTVELDASGRLLMSLAPAPAEDAGGPADLERIVDAWVTAVRRWCRRYARVGLWTLVRRPARMSFTRTHVDVMLALRGADVRVRAAGLDVDPGWVPWLGRVIGFQYVD
jgi:hypothetical protein